MFQNNQLSGICLGRMDLEGLPLQAFGETERLDTHTHSHSHTELNLSTSMMLQEAILPQGLKKRKKVKVLFRLTVLPLFLIVTGHKLINIISESADTQFFTNFMVHLLTYS